jgi:hypothetical protein
MKPRMSAYIILDQASMSYIGILSKLCCQYEHVHIDFLCGYIPELSHFNLWLKGDGNITHRCLNIPVNEWEEWKKHPEYRGK